MQAAEHLRSCGVPSAPIKDVDELVDDPQVRARHMLLELHDPEWGAVRVDGNPIKASGAAPPRAEPPPALGAHTGAILSTLAGLDSAAIDALRTAAVI